MWTIFLKDSVRGLQVYATSAKNVTFQTARPKNFFFPMNSNWLPIINTEYLKKKLTYTMFWKQYMLNSYILTSMTCRFTELVRKMFLINDQW